MPSAASAGQSSRDQTRACSACSSSTRSRASRERLLRRAPVGRADGDPGRGLAAQAGDPRHEELVEHVREDRAEPHALEQRQVGVLREREHARVVVEERQLAVDQAIGRSRRPLLRADSRHAEDPHPPGPDTRQGVTFR